MPRLDLSPLEDLDRVALAHLHDGLLPARPRAAVEAGRLRLRLALRAVHALGLHVEELLDGLPHLGLVRPRVHAEGVLAVGDQRVALLAHDRREEHFVRMQAHEALPCTSGSAASVTRSERAQTTAATSSSPGEVTATRSRFRNDFTNASCSGSATTTAGSSLPHSASSAAAVFVDGSKNESSARTPNVPFAAWLESAPGSAERRALRLTLISKLRGLGGKARPPPVNCGARIVPARARPVPFWRHGLARPPETRPRLFAPRVPARRALSSARTVSCTRCGFTSAPKISASRVTCFAALPPPSSSGALGAAMGPLLSHLDETVLRAGNRARDEEQVLLRVDAVDREPDLRDALAAEAAGHLHALEDARGRRGGADRAGLADVVRAVRHGAAAEAVALDRAGQALADRHAGDLHVVAGLERLDGHRLAHGELAPTAELDEVP